MIKEIYRNYSYFLFTRLSSPAEIQLLFALSDRLESNFHQQISKTVSSAPVLVPLSFVISKFWSTSCDLLHDNPKQTPAVKGTEFSISNDWPPKYKDDLSSLQLVTKVRPYCHSWWNSPLKQTVGTPTSGVNNILTIHQTRFSSHSVFWNSLRHGIVERGHL